MSGQLCLLTATGVEFRIAAGLLHEPVIAIEDGIDLARSDHIILLKTEIGAPGFAAKFAAHLSRQNYRAVLVAGFAGALDPQLALGEAVVYDRCINAGDGRSIACDGSLSERIGAARGAGLTVDRVIDRADEKRRLYHRWGAAAADMESFEVLALCAERGLSAAALRVISDVAGEDLPDFNRALRADGKIDNRQLPRVFFARPHASWRFLASIGQVKEAFKDALKSALEEAMSREWRS